MARKPEQLTEEEPGFVQEWHQEDAYPKHIYQALESHALCAKSNHTDEQAIKRLAETLLISSCGAVSKIAKAIIAREKEMIETILLSFSNGIMEGTNNKIKLIKRHGFGYRNDAHLFLRLWLETGH